MSGMPQDHSHGAEAERREQPAGLPPPGHHGAGSHPGHGAHGDVGRSDHAAQFRDRFWISLLLALPVVGLSRIFSDLLGYTPPTATAWVPPVLGTAVFFYGGWPFLTGAVTELKDRQPGMMLLISLAISVSFGASLATSLGIGGVSLDFLVGAGALGRHHVAWPLAGDARAGPGFERP
jgi:P-type Cu2+ transporter